MKRSLLVRSLVFVSALGAFCLDSKAVFVTFTADYAIEGAGEGFNDPTLGMTRKSAFEYALGIVSTLFDATYAGETYQVRAKFDPLGGGAMMAKLGEASPEVFYSGLTNPVETSGRFYPSSLASHRDGIDINAITMLGPHEINITFNSDVDNATVLGATDWYYGTDAMPGTHIDLVSVALHEMTHGLGFSGFLTMSGVYSMGDISIFDHFMNTDATAGSKLTSLSVPGRMAEVTGEDLWWDGSLGTAGNGGTRPELYAPSPFEPGSSLYHLDEATLGSQLLSPVYSGPDHTFSAMERGMLADIGWTLSTIPEPRAWLYGGMVTCLIGLGVVLQHMRERSGAVPPVRLS